MGTDETGKINSGGMGTSNNKSDQTRGGDHGEKRATNADHDQKIAENRKRMLNEPYDGAPKMTSKIAPRNDDPSPGSPHDDVLGQTKKRKSVDPDRERRGGDIVSGGEHSQFPDTQAGYDDRKENERPLSEPQNDLTHLDKGRNDDLSQLDRSNMDPLK